MSHDEVVSPYTQFPTAQCIPQWQSHSVTIGLDQTSCPKSAKKASRISLVNDDTFDDDSVLKLSKKFQKLSDLTLLSHRRMSCNKPYAVGPSQTQTRHLTSSTVTNVKK